jgi:hypothetical protein
MNAGQDAVQRFDDGLQFPDQRVDDDAAALPATGKDHEAFAVAAVMFESELVSQAHVGQGLAAQIENAAFAVARRQVYALDDHFQRNDELRVADGDLEAIDDRKRQRQLDLEPAASGLRAEDFDIAA